jgi:hypothetical protein
MSSARIAYLALGWIVTGHLDGGADAACRVGQAGGSLDRVMILFRSSMFS